MYLNIGLHSQTLKDSSGVISGSEITTGSLMSAFVKHDSVANVTRFSSGNYHLLEQNTIDLMIIEGWHPDLPVFIKDTRKFCPKAVILFWNLSFYGFNGVVKLDVDGFLTNSRKNALLLNKIKPTKFVMLAADLDNYKIEDFNILQGLDVTYLGFNHPNKSEALERLVLYEAKEFGLSIYGAGWENHPFLKECSKGILPINDIKKLYSNSKIVLGMTEERQRKSGMINNRVFEALSCGVCFISEYSSELERVFGDGIFFVKNEGDTKNNISKILENYHNLASHRRKVIEMIANKHTYSHRVIEILDFYKSFIQ